MVDSHHGLVKLNKRGRLGNINDVFVFANNINKCITHTLFLKMIIIELIGFSLWKPNLEAVFKLFMIVTMK
jgi:hypothetical protein